MAVAWKVHLITFFLLLFINGFCYSKDLSIAQQVELIKKISGALKIIKQKLPTFRLVIEEMTAMMEPLKGILQCEKGWHQLESTCYFFSDTEATWEVSNQKCIGMKAYFAKIKEEEVFDFTQKLVLGKTAWLGMRRYGQRNWYRWVKDNSLHSHVYHWWDKDEPSNKQNKCAYFQENGKWDDADCEESFRYICEKPAAVTLKETS